MMRNTEKTALLKPKQDRAGCFASTGHVLSHIREVVNRPVNRANPSIERFNEAAAYADPLIYTLLGLGLYDLVLNNAAGFPKKYNTAENWSDMLILGVLLGVFSITALNAIRDPNKRSRGNTAIIMAFILMNAILNGFASVSFTEDTIFALSLDKTDPNGSTPSDSNMNVFYDISSASLVVGATLGVMSFLEDYIRDYQKNGRVFAQSIRDCAPHRLKQALGIVYTVARTFAFGSQFDGGTINQATTTIMQDWSNISLEHIQAETRTKIFVGGHAAGFLLSLLLLSIKSTPIKELVERGYNAIAGLFFLEEYITNRVNSISENHQSNAVIGWEGFAEAFTWLTIIGGTIALAVNTHRKKAANQEMFSANGLADEEKDISSSSVGEQAEQAAVEAPKKSSSSSYGFARLFSESTSNASSSDPLPVDEDIYLAQQKLAIN